MGAKQSQDSTTNATYSSGDSTLLEPAAVPGHQHQHQHHHRQEDPDRSPPVLPSLFSLFSGSLTSTSEGSSRNQSMENGRDELSPSNIFERHDDTREEEGTLFEHGNRLEYSSRVSRDQDGSSHRRHHLQDGPSHLQDDLSHPQDMPHHHHHQHHHRHHHHHGRERDHNGRDRRSHRYMHRGELDRSNNLDMELDFSLAALNERLRALQLRRENEESGSGSSSSERHGRSHSSGSRMHSRRRHDNSLMPSGALMFMTRPERMATCPFCKKEYSSSDMEGHMVICITKPRVKYNEDRLLQDSGECSICLEDMYKGDTIARLPCLCIYHVKCLKQWYEKNQTCPEHPEIRSA